MMGASRLALSCVGLAACTFDVSQYSPTGSGGSASSGSHAVVGSTSSVGATQPTSSTIGSSGATTTSASGMGGGAPLAPCGMFTDTFTNFPNSPKWTATDTSPSTPGVLATVMNQQSAGAVRDGASYDNCYSSIELVDNSSGGVAGLRLTEGTGNAYVYVSYSLLTKTVSWSAGDTNGEGRPVALAIVFANGSVYFMYMKSGTTTWSHGGKQKRASWMDNSDTALSFGVVGLNGSSAKFDNFNVRVVKTSDLW